MSTILRAFNDLGDKYDLDVFNEQQFLLDISAIESGDIGRVFGISSQTFSLPPTPNNNEYFGNLFDLGVSYPSGSLTNQGTAPTTFIKTMPCQVLNDGVAIFNGRLYLENVITDNDGDIIYNVNVVNETIDFKFQIQDLTFGDLDWSEYNHNYTYGNITSSWSENLFGGDIVYPLVEYGSQQNDIGATEIKSGGAPSSFTNEDYPLRVEDFKPAIRLSAVMDKVFDTLDYKYTSSLFESDYMDKVYMLSTKDASKGTTFTNPTSQNFKAETSTTFNAGTSTIIEANNEIYDNAGNYNPIAFEFRPDEDGDYSFDVSLDCLLTGISFPQNPRQAYIELFRNGSPSDANGFNIPAVWFNLKGSANNDTPTLNANFKDITINTGDVITFRISYETEAGEASFLTINAQSYVLCYQSPLTSVGGVVNLKGIFDEETSVLEWLNGVIQKFNLVIEPLANNSKILSVETFNDWVDAGETKDWTDIIDRSVKWEINHPMARNPRTLYFTDEEDKDSANQYSIQNLDKIFGDRTYVGESDLATGERTIGTFFAPTPMKYIEGTNTFIVPRIYTLKDGNKEPFVFKPRLLHFVGIKNADALRGRDRSNNFTTGEYYMRDENQVLHTLTTYPQFHHNEFVPTDGVGRDLHFGNGNHWEYHQAHVDAFTKRDAFYEYWAFYVNELYDVDSRLLTCNVALKPTDIPTIALNDKIFIDGHYYRINKISGANLTNEQSTKVELLKTLPRKSRFPRRRIFYDDFSGYDDVFLPDDNIQFTGSVVYNGWNSGQPITSSVVTEKAGYKDGLFVYSGSVTIGTPQQPIEKNNNFVLGNNYVDTRAHDVIVQGGGNAIQTDSSNVHIVGSNNQVLDNAKNTILFGDNSVVDRGVGQVFVVNTNKDRAIAIPTGSENIVAINPVNEITELDNGRVVIGNAKIQGAMFEDFTNIEVGNGTTTYLTGSDWTDTFHFHFQYTSSVNGTAQVFIETPLSASTEGEQKRFTTDGGLTASKLVNIAPYTGSIDGSPEKALTTAYDGLTIAQINNEWQVIQEKAK